MAKEQRVAVVTGGNRGLGLAACEQLAGRGYRVLLCSRNEAKGRAAASSILEGEVEVWGLDVADRDSVLRFGVRLRDEVGRADVLVNNAGMLARGEDSILTMDEVGLRDTLRTNLFGALEVAQQLVPLMRKSGYGRVVNVSSGLGQLSDMKSGSVSYRISKTALNAITRMLAYETHGENVLVNAVCPGWVRTEMGGANANRSIEEGVDTIVWAATLPDDGPSGGFFRDRQPIPW